MFFLLIGVPIPRSVVGEVGISQGQVQGTSQFPTTVEVRPTFDRHGYDFSAYLGEINDRVQKRWSTAVSGEHSPGYVVISMDVRRDGSVLNVRLLESSRIRTLDRAAITSIDLSRPFPPLPVEFADQVFSVELHFRHAIVGLDVSPPTALPPGQR
jgi:TonB family protein